jgi:hypothetical protein
MSDHRVRTVGGLRWLRLSTGERLTTCARFWLVPYGHARVWWLYHREHAGDLRRTRWRLVYRSHKMAAAMLAATICQRATAQYPRPLEHEATRGQWLATYRRRVDAELGHALDLGELKAEQFNDAVAPAMQLWGGP